MRKFKINYEITMVLILVAMIVVFGVLTGGLFFKPATMIGCTADVSYLGVQAMAMTLIILTSGIDLSVSYQMVTSAMFCAWTFKLLSGSMGTAAIIPAVIVCILAGFVCGGINGFIAKNTSINPWLITMSTMYIFTAVSWFFATSFAFAAGNPVVDIGNMRIAGIVPTQFIVLIIVFIVFYYLEKKTTFGRYVHAIGFNENAVNYSGVNAGKMKFWVYALGGLTNAIAALMYMGRGWQVNQETGANMNIEVIALVVLGGTSTAGGVGGVVGTFIACLMIGVLKKGLALMGLPGTVYNFVVGIVLIVSLIFFAYQQKRKQMVSRKMAIQNMEEQE